MTPDERYSRQIRFEPLGTEGQRALREGCALLVGVGALGSHVAEALARAGVGRLHLVDRDVVELQNLQRQHLFDEEDARRGAPKAVAAAHRLAQINSECAVTAHAEDFDTETFEGLAPRPDLVIDGTDNFATRYLINDLAVRDGTPWIYGAAVGAAGRAMAVLPGTTPCLRCVLDSAPPVGEIGTCETEGILEPAVAQVAAFQTVQAIKILARQPEQVTRGMFVADLWRGEFAVRLRSVRPDPQCRSCGTRELPAIAAGPPHSISLCGREAVQIRPSGATRVDLARLAARLRGVAADVELTEHLLRFTAEECRFSVFRGGRTLLFGTSEPVRARTLYDRYVGAS